MGRRIDQTLGALLPGLAVESLAEIDSTNTELMRRARAGRLDPVLLVAQRQTAGRGRLGRQWLGEPGASLTFSLGLLLAPPDWSGLSLAVGVAVAEALHPAVRLKWPNDLWVQDRKLGGILIETAAPPEGGGAARFTIVGIGLNLATPEGAGYATPPFALRELLPHAGASAVLQQVAPPVLQAVRGFEQFGFAPFQARFQARDALAGRAVRLSDGSTGTAHGVDAQGALLVHTAAGMKAVATAEVSVRPA
ncbi:biotin--[acetyl-CoA-carboxylase] ligase [Ramlibacter sp.]|uniref:biotin--[acetyl-CoA-carboxylase] ligase n=1 Tax=Ramlibacter sp. TaxID=1917967 RepID=UPI002FC6F703